MGGEHWLLKHEVLSSNPQLPHRKPGMATRTAVTSVQWGRGDRRVPKAEWPPSHHPGSERDDVAGIMQRVTDRTHSALL